MDLDPRKLRKSVFRSTARALRDCGVEFEWILRVSEAK